MSAKQRKDSEDYYVENTAKKLTFIDKAYHTPSNSNTDDVNSLINRVARIAQGIFRDSEDLEKYSFAGTKKLSAEEYAKLKREGAILKEGSSIFNARTQGEVTGAE